ncbi:hypothetical protein EDB86DRAFT_3247418, partial [Lactarius hatsudake]
PVFSVFRPNPDQTSVFSLNRCHTDSNQAIWPVPLSSLYEYTPSCLSRSSPTDIGTSDLRQKRGPLWGIDCESFCPLKASSHLLRLHRPSGRVPLCRASHPPSALKPGNLKTPSLAQISVYVNDRYRHYLHDVSATFTCPGHLREIGTGEYCTC